MAADRGGPAPNAGPSRKLSGRHYRDDGEPLPARVVAAFDDKKGQRRRDTAALP